METGIDDLAGMDRAGAREYIAHFITTLKLTEKKRAELGTELKRWEDRVSLARSRGMEDLAAEAEKEAARIREREDALAREALELGARIEVMKGRLPALAARERSVDPDLLEQELIIARGGLPGDGERAAVDRALGDLEKEAAAQAALEALKAKAVSRDGELP